MGWLQSQLELPRQCYWFVGGSRAEGEENDRTSHVRKDWLHKALFGVHSDQGWETIQQKVCHVLVTGAHFSSQKIFPTASVLLVNVCVCVGRRREPGKTSWVPDQKMDDFIILYRVEVKRIMRKLSCVFVPKMENPKWQYIRVFLLFWNNRVRTGKTGANFARYALHQPELVTEEGGENVEHAVATRALLFLFHWVTCSVWEVCVYEWRVHVCTHTHAHTHRRVTVRERGVCEYETLLHVLRKFFANPKIHETNSLV